MPLLECPNCCDGLLLRRRIGRRGAYEAERLEYQAARAVAGRMCRGGSLRFPRRVPFPHGDVVGALSLESQH